jgi:WD40 repeat protein
MTDVALPTPEPKRSSFKDIISGETMRSIPLPAFGGELKVELDYSGEYLAVSNGDRLAVIEVATGKISETTLPGGGWPPLSMAIAPNGRFVAAAPSSIQVNENIPTFLIDVHNGSSQLIRKQLDWTKVLHFSAKGDLLALGSLNGRIDVFATDSRTFVLQLQTLSDLRTAAFSEDGRFLAVGARGAASVYVVATGTELTRVSTEEGPTLRLAP